MTRNPISTSPQTTINEAAKIMRDKKVGSLVIVEEGKLLGLLTEKDIVIKIAANNSTPKDFTVAEIMTPVEELITVESSRNIYDAMVLMKDNDVRRLPVVDNNKLAGIITSKDVLKIDPDLFDMVVDLYDVREADRKIRR